MILMISTLAIVGVLFAVYQYSEGIDQPATSDSSREFGPTRRFGQPTLGSDNVIEAGPQGQATVGAAERIQFRQYETKGSRVRAELSVKDFRPIGKSVGGAQRVELDEPIIRLVTPDGQLVRIRSQTGHVDVDRGEKTQEAKRGTLSGGVEITIDRLTHEERGALSEDERDLPGEDRLIRIKLDSLSFDRESMRIDSASAFHLTMSEAEVSGTGLRIEYNDVDRRLEHFEITEGGLIVVYGSMGDLGRNGLNDRDGQGERAGQRDIDQDRADHGGTGRGENDQAESGVSVATASVGPDSSASRVYRAEIEDNIIAKVFDRSKATQQLTADQLGVVFEFARRQRGRDAKSSDPQEPANIQDGSNRLNDDRMTLQWSGRLLVRPEGVDDSETVAPGRRLEIVAKGKNVRLEGDQLSIGCQLIRLDQQREQVWIEADAGQDVRLEARDRGVLTTPSVFVDLRNGHATIKGPARFEGTLKKDTAMLSQTGQASRDRAVELRFERGAELTLSPRDGTKRDTMKSGVAQGSASTSDASNVYVSAMTMQKDVVFKHGDQLVAAERIDLEFDPPDPDQSTSTNVTELVAAGDVLMVRNQDRLTCGELDVSFRRGPGGQNMARFATARDDVVLSQADLLVTARDEVSIEMVSVLKDKGPFDTMDNRLRIIRSATASGLDVASINWAKARAKYDADVKYESTVRNVSAQGGVTAYDETRGLEVSAESLSGTIGHDRSVERLRVTGPDGRNAFVKFREFAISAHSISADVSQQRADVFGPGEIRFTTKKGLDGSQTNDPQTVDVSWTQEMTLRGAQNTARFRGDVHAVSRQYGDAADITGSRSITPVSHQAAEDNTTETVAFNADELVIDFVDVPPLPTVEDRWWIFAPIVQRIIAKPHGRPQLFDTKEAAYVVASRDVTVVFSKTDVSTGRVSSRARLAGDKLTADLRARLVSVPTAGTLLVEEYDRASKTSADNAKPLSLFRSNDNGLPSQTFASWTGSLTFHASQNRADFRDNVKLIYRSGDQMLFANDLIEQYAFDRESFAGKGRQTRLDCATLVVEFDEPGAGADAGAGTDTGDGVGAIQLKNLRQMSASGGVVVQDDAFNIEAWRIVKYEQSDLLRVFGLNGQPAEIYSNQPNGPRFKGSEFNYNLITERIDAPNLQVRGRR
jgi:hypothetical protein